MRALNYKFCNILLDSQHVIQPWYNERVMTCYQTVVVFINMFLSRLLTLNSSQQTVTMGSPAMIGINKTIDQLDDVVGNYDLLSRRLITITRMTLPPEDRDRQGCAEVLYRRVCMACFLIGMSSAFNVSRRRSKVPAIDGFIYFEEALKPGCQYVMSFLQTKGICGSLNAPIFVRLVRYFIGGWELFQEFRNSRTRLLHSITKHMPDATHRIAGWLDLVGRHLHEPPRLSSCHTSRRHQLPSDSEESKFIWEMLSVIENRQRPLFIKANSLAHVKEHTQFGWMTHADVSYVTMERGNVSMAVPSLVYDLLRHVLECIPCDNTTRILGVDSDVDTKRRPGSFHHTRRNQSSSPRVMRFNKKGCISANDVSRVTCRRNIYRVLKSVVETVDDYSVHVTATLSPTPSDNTCSFCRSTYNGHGTGQSKKRCIVIASEYITLVVDSFNAFARHHGVKACMRLKPHIARPTSEGTLRSLTCYADHLTHLHRRSGLTAARSKDKDLSCDTQALAFDERPAFDVGIVKGIVEVAMETEDGTLRMNALNKNIVNNCDLFNESVIPLHHVESYSQDKENSFVQKKFTQKGLYDNANTVSRYTNSKSVFSTCNENLSGDKCKQMYCMTSYLYWAQRQLGRQTHMFLVGRPRQSNYCSTIDINGVENQCDVTPSLVSRSLPNFPGSKRHNLVEKHDKSTMYLKNTLASDSHMMNGTTNSHERDQQGQAGNLVIVSPIYSRSCINVPKICGASLVTVMEQEVVDLTAGTSVVEIDYRKNELLCRQEGMSRSLLTQVYRLSVEMMVDMDMSSDDIYKYTSTRLCLAHAGSFSYRGTCKIPRNKTVGSFFYPQNARREASRELLAALHEKHKFYLGAYQKHFRARNTKQTPLRDTANRAIGQMRKKRKMCKNRTLTIPYEPPKRSSNFVTCCATMSVGDHNVSLFNYIEYVMKKKENAGMHRTGSILNTVVSIVREFLFKRNKRIKPNTTDCDDLPLPRTFTKETP